MTQKTGMPNYFANDQSKKIVSGLILFALLMILGTAAFIALRNRGASAQQNNEQAAVPAIVKEVAQTLEVSFGDAKNQEKLQYEVQSAEVADQITVQGQTARAVEGRSFLLFNLKITNPTSKNVQLNSRDFIRVSVDEGTEWMAPEIHNDPVEVQAISTKYTRVGLPIDDTITSIKLQLGEINKEKKVLDLQLR